MSKTTQLVILSGSSAMYDPGDEVMHNNLSWKIYGVNKTPVQFKYDLIRKTDEGHTLIRHNIPQDEIWSFGKQFANISSTVGDGHMPNPSAHSVIVHYEVESHLNPRYLETGYPSDYFGIYEVIKYEGDTRTPIKSFEGGEGRSDAYRLAGELQTGKTELPGEWERLVVDVIAYQKHTDLPCATHFMTGDGEKKEWQLDYVPVEVIAVYVSEYREDFPYPIPVQFYKGDTVLNGNSISISPIIPSNLLVQVDYWFSPDEMSRKYAFHTTLPIPTIVRYEEDPPFGENDIVYKIGIDNKGFRWKIMAAIGKLPIYMPMESL